MKSVASKIKPASGFSHFFHIGLLLLLPTLMFVLVRIKLTPFAAVLILLSKWRMFAVRPRYWPANIRANAVDMIVGLSFLIFMTNTNAMSWQLLWAVLYGVWLTVIKPGSGMLKVIAQGAIGQTLGLFALFMAFGGANIYILVISVWVVCYLSARHFLTAFDESHISFLAHTWGYFAAAMTWVLSHWLLFYGLLAQTTLLLTVISFSLATIYYLDHTDRLSLLLRRQFVFIMIAIIVVVLVFSDWGDKTI
ncbi:hypothetical protein KDA00_01480 [Candidatus Saccharibacteria bacterium]|nr:hypothetical protein [Candidatus Saccharibacteria bacterium]